MSHSTSTESDQKEDVVTVHHDVKESEPLAMENGENDKTLGEWIPEAAFDSQSECENKYDENLHDVDNSKREDKMLKTELHLSENDAEEYKTEVTYKNEPDVYKKGKEDKRRTETDEDNVVRKCEPCLFDEIEEKAAAFCAACIEYLCNSCARDHRRSKLTRSHKVLNGNEMPTDSSIFKMMKSMMLCPDHQSKDVSYKCEQHEKFICTTCLAVNHRKCDEVKEISNEPMSSTSRNTGIPVIDTLQSIYDKMVSVRIIKEENINKMRLNHTSVMEAQSAFIESLRGHLLKLEESSKTETETLFKKELEELEREVDACKEIESSEVKYKELLDVTVKYGSIVELNVISALTMEQINLLKDETEKQAETPPVYIAFKGNNEFSDISSIGKAFVTKDENNDGLHIDTFENSSDIIATDDIDQGIAISTETKIHNPLMHSTINKTRTMHDLRQFGSRWPCSLTKVLTLLDDRIIATDYNNENMKILNSDFSIKSVCKLVGEPIDMCQTSSNHLAVIFDGKKMIKRYTVEDGINDDGSFPSKLFPISIDKSQESDDHVIILFSEEERNIEVQIRNVRNGAVLKQLTGFKGKSSQTLVLEDPGRIRVIPKQQNSCIISENKKVHCFGKDKANANELIENWFYKSYRDSIIDDVSDVATDKEGNIYVCGKSSKNVHQISGRNFMQNRVLLSVPGIPLSICVHDQKRLLIIGCENDDFIYVASFD